MLSNPDLQPIMPATRHNLRVMAFAVAGMLCGALIMGIILLALKEEKTLKEPAVLGEQLSVYPTGAPNVGEGSPTLHKMDTGLALPLLALVFCLLISAGFVRAIGDRESRKGELAKRFRF